MEVDDFIYMSGYGFYVWASYAITLIIFILNIFFSFIHRIKFLNDLNYRNKHEDQSNNEPRIPVVEKK